jgi:Na+/proline symporter
MIRRVELETGLRLEKELTGKAVGNGSVYTGNDDDYFERLVKINLENLAAYYLLVKQHTDKSFAASLMVGVAGFILLSTGIVLGIIYRDDKYISLAGMISGVIVSFISAVFFYLYKRKVQQLKGYHDSLLSAKNILLAFKVIKDTPEMQLKSDIIIKLIEYLTNKDR